MSDIMSISVNFNSTVVTTMHKVGKKKVKEKVRVSTVQVGEKVARISGSLLDIMEKILVRFGEKETDYRYIKTCVEVRVIMSVPELGGFGKLRDSMYSVYAPQFKKFVITGQGKEVICGAGHILQIKK